MKQPLLSIVVPTKNRYYYLKHLIKYVNNFETDEVELLVHDNSDDNAEMLDFIKEGQYRCLSYYYTNDQLSVSENADLAIYKSKGEYVCFIGDDDGVTNEIIDQVKFLKNNSIEAMITRLAVYNWPDYKDESIYKLSASLSLRDSKKKNYLLNSKEELHKVAKAGFANIGLLPKVYQGIVCRTALDKLFEKCGSYFPGPSPDMANAVALTAIIEEYIYSDVPTIITGQSKYVGGGERLLKKLMPLSEIPHLPKDIMDYWDNKLPKLWCTETIWPGSAIIAANKVGLSIRVNYDKIYGRFIFNHPSHASDLDNFECSKLMIEIYKINIFFKKAQKWAYNRLTYYMSNHKKIGGCTIYRNLNTINKAAEVLSLR